MSKEKIMIYIQDLYKFLEQNNLTIFHKVNRHLIDLDKNDLFALLSQYAKTKDDLFDDYIHLIYTDKNSDIEDLQRYIKILNGDTKLNPQFVYTKEECQTNIIWAKNRIKVLEYEQTSEYRYQKKIKEKEEEDDRKRQRDLQKARNIGFIYLVDDGNCIKIGQTKYLSQRLSSISIEVGKDIKLLHSSQVVGYELRERELQSMFNHKKVRGEWFSLNASDILTIKEYLGKFETNNLVTPA